MLVGCAILWVYGMDEPEADTGITGDLAMSQRELYYELRRGGMGRETARACVVETSLMGRLDRLDYWLAKLQERTRQIAASYTGDVATIRRVGR